jgi:hypothetical protein
MRRFGPSRAHPLPCWKMRVLPVVALVAAAVMPPIAAAAQTAGAPLELEAKIPLGAVSGRIDHLGIDPKRQRLLVAELGKIASASLISPHAK